MRTALGLILVVGLLAGCAGLGGSNLSLPLIQGIGLKGVVMLPGTVGSCSITSDTPAVK